MDTSTSETAPANPFAAAQTNTNAAFGGTPAKNPFGAPSNTSSAFGTNSQAQPNPFARPAPSQSQARDFPYQNPYPPGSEREHPLPESYIERDVNRTIIAFHGKPVVYRVNGELKDQPPLNSTPDQRVPGIGDSYKSWRKILFPNGPPLCDMDTEPDPAQYTDEVKAAYAQMFATNIFDYRFQGDMPEVPPKRVECVWNL
jgi:nucleoporin NUP42